VRCREITKSSTNGALGSTTESGGAETEETEEEEEEEDADEVDEDGERGA